MRSDRGRSHELFDFLWRSTHYILEYTSPHNYNLFPPGSIGFLAVSQKQLRSEIFDLHGYLQASGKLESFLAKRRKKNASKDHRYIPTKRRSAGTD